MQDSNNQNNKKVKYYSALDEADNLVYIDDVNEENRNQHNYRCPSCKGPMIPVLGKKNTHHFRHDVEHCSYESYLHELAKIRFKDAFEQRDKFLVEVDEFFVCDKFGKCFLHNLSDFKKRLKNRPIPNGCMDNYKKVLNLKYFYDVCELEKGYKGFIADILLRDSHNKHEPIFLEIYVSHPCDEEKIQSGIPIIEFKINDEEKLNELLKQNVFKEQKNVPIANKKKKTEDKVLFYNLERLGDLKPYEEEWHDARYMRCSWRR